jgi:anti-sigma-K factor RskA
MSPDDRDRLAGEHVMGLLDGDERREAERLLASDAAFQAAVAAWQARFAELDASARTADEPDRAADRPVRAADPSPVVVPDPRNAFKALWRNLAFWRAAGIAGAFATITLAAGLGVLADRSGRSPVLVAVLLNEANQPAGVINAYRNGQAELVPFEGMQVPSGRSFEVWAIPGPNQNPISVGVVTEPRSLRLNLQRVPNLAPNHIFAISVEPPQGSPTGLPTGPVLMRGTATTAL